MIEGEVWKNHWEELPCRGDDSSVVAIKEGYGQVYEDLTEGARDTDHHYISEDRRILENSDNGIVLLEKELEGVDESISH